MIIKNGLIHSLEKGFYPDTIYIEETRFISLLFSRSMHDLFKPMTRFRRFPV